MLICLAMLTMTVEGRGEGGVRDASACRKTFEHLPRMNLDRE